MDPREEQLLGWARAVNWRHTQIAVLVGYGAIEPWRVLARFRPNVHVVCFEPDTAEAQRVTEAIRPGWVASPRSGGAVYSHGVHRVSVAASIVGVRQIVTSICRPGWHAEVTGSGDALSSYGLDIFKDTLEATIDGQREKLAMEFTTRSNAERWGQIGLEQLRRVIGHPIVNHLGGTLKGAPAIVVGAGPSLSRDLDRLRQVEGRALIIATNSAVGPLDDAGIQPDIICAVESRHESIAPVVGLRAWRRAIVVPGIHANSLAWDSPSRALLPDIQSVGAVGAWLTKEFVVPSVQSGGSVATMAYGVARLLGCSPIMLIGCDCAQGTDGLAFHADGARHDPADAPHGEIEVPRWGGGTVRSTDALVHYLHWFEARAAEHRGAGLSPIINCSRGGAHIEGSLEEELRKVLWELPRERRDFRAEILSAMQDAPVIPREAAIGALRRQRAETESVCNSLDGDAEAVISIANRMIAFTRDAQRAPILAGMTVGDVEENERYPELPQLVALANLLQRTASKAPDVVAQIDRALEALEEDQREADQDQSRGVDTSRAAAVA